MITLSQFMKGVVFEVKYMSEIVPGEVGERCQRWIGMNNRCFSVTSSFPVAKNER